MQLFRNERNSLKCDINQDKMQKMQLDILLALIKNAPKKRQKEAFRMLLEAFFLLKNVQ